MILITGATGLLGSYLLNDLILQNEQVCAIARTHSDFSLVRNLKDRVKWIEADLLDVNSIQLAMEGVDQVYHCGAMVSFDSKHHELMMQVNVEGTANVVNAALANGVKKLVYVSSVAALGRSQENEIITEETPWINGKKNSKYAISKMLAEREVFRGVAEGLAAAVVNPSIIIGKGNWYNSSAALFQTVFDGLRFYTPGVTGYVSAQDVSSIMIQLMNSDITNERFIVSENNYSYYEILKQIANGLKKPEPNVEAGKFLTSIAWRAAWLKTYFTGGASLITRETATSSLLCSQYDNTKIKQALNFSFTPIAETIASVSKQFLEEHRA